MMRYSALIPLFLVWLLLSPLVTSASRLLLVLTDPEASKTAKDVKPIVKSETYVATKQRKSDTLQIAGSGLPDCSHACGACRPCRLVMVSFVCATIEEAETCPMAYKCMCRERAFPVP